MEELYTRPFEDIAVEEFLDQLPKPQIEEIEEPEPMDTSSAPRENADTPMDTSGVKAGTGDLPQGKMPEPAETEAADVPMEAIRGFRLRSVVLLQAIEGLRFRIIIYLKHAPLPSCGDFGSSGILNTAPSCGDSGSSYILNTPPRVAIPVHHIS